ncbi:NAD(P)/FAD-dependent oxidoreductase [Streptomyces sp. NBC_01618]|uniref:NAD(P)/FAD-dependent oxidoreductase n=1 Tax=Streptomyces sp. NBC_01618 TaxID=2975900 RepID=UPI0038643047|nr:FAD-dependent oxidoreductase [Streptomyces sp. NBC_01618]
MKRCLIVGGSAAGMRTAAGIARGGYDGVVTVLDADAQAPYDRTVLSTGFLTGARQAEGTVLDVPDGVEWLCGVRAQGLDLDRQVVRTDAGEFAYTDLVLATGGVAHLPAAWQGLEGVLTLRTMHDAEVLRDAAAQAAHVVVVGGGVLGMEIATSLAELGCRVDVVEADDQPLGRVLPAAFGRHLGQRAADHGVTLSCGVSVKSLGGAPRVDRVTLTDGRVVPTDLVVVAVGNRPATGWLADSGLEIEDGVVCDERLQAGAPHVWVAGDLARVRHGDGSSERSEHWTRAGEHGTYVAQAILGEVETGFSALSYVWSDLLGTRVQVLGSMDFDQHLVLRSGADGGQVAALAVQDGVLRGAAVIGWQRMAMTLRRALVQGLSPAEVLDALPPDVLRETSILHA